LRFAQDVARVAARFTGVLRVVRGYAVEAPILFLSGLLVLVSFLIFSFFVVIIAPFYYFSSPSTTNIIPVQVHAFPYLCKYARLTFRSDPIMTRITTSLPGKHRMRLRYSHQQIFIL